MNTLLEIANVSPELKRIAQRVETRKRNAQSYIGRMGKLYSDANVFAKCNQERPKKRYRNNVCSEQAGTMPLRVVSRNVGQYTNVVCRTRV